MTSRNEPVRDEIAADIQRINRDLAAYSEPGKTRSEGDRATVDALLDARNHLTELAKGLTAPPSESVSEGTS